jgi:hypothetical protein
MEINELYAANIGPIYPVGTTTQAQRDLIRNAHAAKRTQLFAEWKASLAGKYADDLPEAAQDAIYHKIWEMDPDLDYINMETIYSHLADLLRGVLREL